MVSQSGKELIWQPSLQRHMMIWWYVRICQQVNRSEWVKCLRKSLFSIFWLIHYLSDFHRRWICDNDISHSCLSPCHHGDKQSNGKTRVTYYNHHPDFSLVQIMYDFVLSSSEVFLLEMKPNVGTNNRFTCVGSLCAGPPASCWAVHSRSLNNDSPQ